MILLVSLKVSPEIVDASREDRYLDWGTSTIIFVDLILFNNVFFAEGCSGLRDAVVPRKALLNKGCRGTKANLMPDRGAFGAAVYIRAPPYPRATQILRRTRMSPSVRTLSLCGHQFRKGHSIKSAPFVGAP